MPLTRRDMIGRSLLTVTAAIGSPTLITRALSAAEPGGSTRVPLNRFPRMVQEDFVARVRRVEAANRAAKAAIKTRGQAEAYVKSVRERARRCFGPLPERTPLNARITGMIQRDHYRIEKVIFESRPNFLVTANLYVPVSDGKPRPGVVGSCGHSDTGKGYESYQAFAQGLALQGYVVLLFDPIGQGERLQYPDEAGRSRVGVGVREHLLAGNQQFLVDEFIGSWRAWDGIRALDYLLTRPEVDPRRVGITGNSGGGTMTTWLWALDSRWTMGAPSCFVTTFRRNLENELPADTEQCPPRALALGLDHEDFILAGAPKPVILLAKEHDFFDIRGTEEAFGRLRRIYRLLGAEDRVSLCVGPGSHGYSRELREAMCGWFNRWSGGPVKVTEPTLVAEKPEALQCTADGQVARCGSRSVASFTRERSQKLGQHRSVGGERELRRALQAALSLPTLPASPDYRILRSLSNRGYPLPRFTAYTVESEPNCHAIVYRLGKEADESRPPAGDKSVILYVAHQSSDAELRESPFPRELVESDPNAEFYACDVRGVGESVPQTCGDLKFTEPYGSDYFYAVHGLMLDAPYVGQRTTDVLAVLRWLASLGRRNIHLAAEGWGTVPATFAAVLSDVVGRVSLRHAPRAFAEIAEAEDYDWPLSVFVPGVLKRFDLPDCYRVLEAKQLRLVEPCGAKLIPPSA